MRTRLTKCKICRGLYRKLSINHKTDKPECALELAKRERERKEKRITRVKLDALKSLKDHLKDAQFEFNAFIRERDKALPCISCGRFHQGQNHAGHYRSVGAAPQLRFNEDNVHLQCSPCNNHKSGNVVEYRINLVKRIGVDRVEALENNNAPALLTIPDAKRIKEEYRRKKKDYSRCLGKLSEPRRSKQ